MVGGLMYNSITYKNQGELAVLPKHLKYYQAYYSDFSNRVGGYKNLYLQNSGITNGSSNNTLTGSQWGDLALGATSDAVSIFSTLMIANAEDKSSERAETQTNNATAISNYTTAAQKVKSIERSIATETKKLKGLNDKLTKANEAATKITQLKGELATLNKNNGITDNNPVENNANVKAYNEAKTKFDSLNSAKTTVESLDTNITSAQSKFDTASKASFTTRGRRPLTIKLDDTGKATPIDEKNYKTIPVTDKKGKVREGEFKLDTANYEADKAKAKQMETDYSNAKSELDSLKEQRKSVLKGVELSENATIAEINNAINDAKMEMNKAGGKKMCEGGTSVDAYNTRKAEIEKQIEEYEALQKEDIASLKEEITKQKDKIDKLENEDLPAAQDKLDIARAACSGMIGAATTLNAAETAYDKEKGEYKDSKSQAGANGKNRTFWQKMWGTNKSATQKAEKQDMKNAKASLKAARNAYKQSGLTPAMEEQLRQAGLIS